MTTTQINGATQIRAASITTTQLSASAGITDGQLASVYLYANGTRAMTGSLQGGGFEATNFGTPLSGTSLATKAYVDASSQGLSVHQSVRFSTVGTETFTVASGSVTTITGTALDSGAPAIGDRILVKDAPASSGTGSVFSLQPGNGIYTVTNATTNLTIARVTDMSGSNGPAGGFVFCEGGTVNGSAGFTVSSPSSSAAFTYGTTSMQWTQFSGAGEITTGNVLTKSANTISVSSMATGTAIIGNGGTATITTISGDLALSSSGVATVQAAAITLSKMATLAANSVIGNSTGSTATPTAVSMLTTPTASAIALRDGSANLSANAYITGAATTATAAGTTTLTVTSAQVQQFTGTTTQIVVLPNATTLAVGQQYEIANRSTGIVTVNMNGGSLLQTMAPGSQLLATAITIGTAAGTWDAAYSVVNAAGGTVTTVSVATANGFAGTVATATSTPAITITTSVTGVLKGNGTSISGASAGTDFMAPGDFVFNETPTGTVGSGNVTFTLANTPIAGTIMLFQNGLLLAYGGGFDFTASGGTITFNTAPVSGDLLRVMYQK